MTIRVICDFDGTITEKDNIVAIMAHFNPPGWEAWKDDILAERCTIQAGVGAMFRLLPSAAKQAIVDFVQEKAVLRQGFSRWVQHLINENIEFNIVSGGIDFFVEPIVQPYLANATLYCNSASFAEETIEILWPNECGDQCERGCGCCKPSVLRKLKQQGDFIVVVGDSITDLAVAQQGDVVFARDYLAERLTALNVPFYPYETFDDIVTVFIEEGERWKKSGASWPTLNAN